MKKIAFNTCLSNKKSLNSHCGKTHAIHMAAPPVPQQRHGDQRRAQGACDRPWTAQHRRGPRLLQRQDRDRRAPVGRQRGAARPCACWPSTATRCCKSRLCSSGRWPRAACPGMSSSTSTWSCSTPPHGATIFHGCPGASPPRQPCSCCGNVQNTVPTHQERACCSMDVSLFMPTFAML